MNISKISRGENFPNEVNVIIENSAGGVPVKYEIDKKSGALFVDRFLQTAMHYPGNYGFVPDTLSGDGDPADVLVLSTMPILAGAVMPALPIGVLVMEDDGGMDEKIIAIPPASIYPYHEGVTEVAQLPPVVLQQIEHFFKHYKDLEKGKWSKIIKWDNAATARKMLEEARERAQKD